MKTAVEPRDPSGPLDYLSLGLTTFGVGYLPLAPGTWGSAVGVAIYIGFLRSAEAVQLLHSIQLNVAQIWSLAVVLLVLFSLLGIWASGRAIDLLGNSDPSEAVVDEVIGQLIVFLFVPFGIGWPFILVGFLLFRLFDIWKPYPIDGLQVLPGGLGICADDIVAGIYAGVCLSVIYAISLSI
jgi:phosphatidylglycerophosphatase A